MADDHERIDLFFELLEWLKQTDNVAEEEIETWLHRSPELDYKQKQLLWGIRIAPFKFRTLSQIHTSIWDKRHNNSKNNTLLFITETDRQNHFH